MRQTLCNELWSAVVVGPSCSRHVFYRSARLEFHLRRRALQRTVHVSRLSAQRLGQRCLLLVHDRDRTARSAACPGSRLIRHSPQAQPAFSVRCRCSCMPWQYAGEARGADRNRRDAAAFPRTAAPGPRARLEPALRVPRSQAICACDCKQLPRSPRPLPQLILTRASVPDPGAVIQLWCNRTMMPAR
jgi:hypothetical protein